MAYDHPMATETALNYDHSYEVRILSEDGELILEDSDFAEEARFIWFDQILKESADPGQTVQLVEKADGTIVEEKIKEPRLEI